MFLLPLYLKLTSANSISKYMKAQQEDVSSNLILLYRGFLRRSDENGITHLSLRRFLKEGFA